MTEKHDSKLFSLAKDSILGATLGKPARIQEECSPRISALTLLCNLGWTFMSPEEAVTARGDKFNEVILREELHNQLKKRRFTFAETEYSLSDEAINRLIAEICDPSLNEGLGVTNKKLYNDLLYGISVTEYIDGKKINPTIALIDWQNNCNNSFLFTEKFKVLRTDGTTHRSPDIVCFVNGIPLVVIEATRPDRTVGKNTTIREGIFRNIRNQGNDEIPLLFVYSQLLISINGTEGRYGTQGTPEKSWASWREEDICQSKIYALRNMPLNDAQKEAVLKGRPDADRHWYDNLNTGDGLALTGQDTLIACLLDPVRLFEMIRYFTVFDNKEGKIIAQYQQLFGIKRLIERINFFTPLRSTLSVMPPAPGEERNNQPMRPFEDKLAHVKPRKGGVIWHASNSGKPFTMALLLKTLILHDNLKHNRILIVTERFDQEDNLSKTIIPGDDLASKKERRASIMKSGRRLAEQISSGSERIIFTVIRKFNTAVNLAECHNDSADLIVLIDEAHRSYVDENHIQIKQALPNATFIVFTSTPLLHDTKSSNTIGPIIHAYTMQQAVTDKTATPLLYEEHIPPRSDNIQVIDSWFDRIIEGLIPAQLTDMKKKLIGKYPVYQIEDRIHMIALDIANHFVKNIDDELKGLLVCENEFSAILYKNYLDETNLLETAVIISPPGAFRANSEADETCNAMVTKWWNDNIGCQSEQDYTKQTITRFEQDKLLKLLIVVNNLLTDFEQPKNTVLYIDRPLKNNELLQVIARINGLHPRKKFGYLIDYRGILAQLDTSITKDRSLRSSTQAGYDINDIAGLYLHMSSEYRRLPHLYNNLWRIFEGTKNKNDIEALRQVLVPRLQFRMINTIRQQIDINLEIREAFYQAFAEFADCMKVALQSVCFFKDTSFTSTDRKHYKEALEIFSRLRQLVKQDSGGKVVNNGYATQDKITISKHGVRTQVKETEGIYEVRNNENKINLEQITASSSSTKIRNQSDILTARISKMIDDELRDDPYAQDAFTALLGKTIEESKALSEVPIKQYRLFQDLEQQVKLRKLSELPASLSENRLAQAIFGIIKKIMPEHFTVEDENVQQRWNTLAFTLSDLVERTVTENSLNPQNIDAEIRRELLPLLFKQCKTIGAGMEQAKAIVDLIIQSNRASLNNKRN